ncbi:MAG: ATP-grasp domain-containing protein [Nitrospirae bacterium]|nr:ATP-grasp domain-containing protein [Nitrospirota bacterium]
MNIIHFSPHFPDNYYLFSVGLKNAGANVLGIGDEPYENLRDELKWAISEYYKVDNMEDYEQILRAVAYLTHKHGKIDRIDSFNEYWLDLEAKIRTDFNMFGIKTDGIDVIKRKSLMKQKFIDAGVPVAKGTVINDIKTAKSFVAEVGYPVVAKPDRGVGALNTYKIKDDKELKDFFAHKPSAEYIFEEFISGDISSFDGLTDRDGNIVFYTGHSYMQGIMETVNDDTHIYYYSYRELPKDLEEAGRNSVKSFGIKERFFHIEFFRTHKEGSIVALEANMRPPGGYTTDMFNYANDLNIYQQWANVVVHNKFDSDNSRKYHCCYIGRKHSKHYLYSHEQVLEKLSGLIVNHMPVSGVFRSAIGDYVYLVRSQNLDEIHKAIGVVHAMEDRS